MDSDQNQSMKDAGGPGSPQPRLRKIVQFGPFELRTDTGELRKHGIRIRMQAKPLQILLALLEQPGEVVTRDQLRFRLWPADTFVDFESGLNTAANRLRIALGDSAETTRYIETLPRVGYRFVAPVRELAVPNPTFPQPSQDHLHADDRAVAQERVVAAPPQLQSNHVDAQQAVHEGLNDSSVAEPRRSGVNAPANVVKTTRAGVWAWAALGVGILATLLILAPRLRPHTMARSLPSFHQLTFERGQVLAARFSPDGTVLYTAEWADHQPKLFVGSVVSPEGRALGFDDCVLAAVSSTGELALIRWDPNNPSLTNTLIRAPMYGGNARDIAHNVSVADWAPDGDKLAIGRREGNDVTVEYPVGHPIFKTGGWIANLRVSPSGDRVAFIEHPLRDDDMGQVRTVDTSGNTKLLASGWSSASGLVWSPSGNEVWFTATNSGAHLSAYAVSMDGQVREVATVPGSVRLLDIAKSGKALIVREDAHTLMSRLDSAQGKPIDVTHFDSSHVDDISKDGNLVLFTESGEAGGPNYAVYLYNRSANSTTRLGKGRALAISPDQKRVISMDVKDPSVLHVVPIGAGQETQIIGSGFRYQWVRFFPDGKRLLVGGSYGKKPLRVYEQSVDGGPLAELPKINYMDMAVVSPDAKHIAGCSYSGGLFVTGVDGSGFHDLGSSELACPLSWTNDGHGVIAITLLAHPWKLLRVDTSSGRRDQLAMLTPQDPGGQVSLAGAACTPDGIPCVYSYHRRLSQLYTVDGWS